jgi:Protein of unknown function (DUF3105)
MAKKKPRAPAPPRKVQAPKVRDRHAGRSGFTMPGTNVWIGGGVVAAVALGVVFVIALSGGGSGENVTPAEVAKVRTAMTAAGCTFRAETADPAQEHMTSADQRVKYRTFPPSSGVHNPTPAIWGNYRVAADPRQVVHDLEHGGIAIWYGSGISPANRGAIDAFYQRSPNAVIVTPISDRYPRVTYPKHPPIDGKIALTTWTVNKKTSVGTVYVAICPTFDQKAFTEFRDTFRGKGAERFPVSRLTPGT